jgi:hypothetical protein
VEFDVKDSTSDEIIKKIDSMLTKLPDFLRFRLSYVANGHRVSVAFSPATNIDEHLESFKDVIGKV